jgi:hypothetical protein
VIEDLSGNIQRVVDGLADEIADRIANDLPADCDKGKIRSHARQVLYDWFLGSFLPRDRR